MSLASSGVVRLAPSCRVIPASCSALSHAISTRCRTRQRCIPHLTFIRSAPGTALTCRGPVCIPPSVARVRLEVAPLGVASSINPLVSSVRAASAIGRSSLARRSPSPLRPRGGSSRKGRRESPIRGTVATFRAAAVRVAPGPSCRVDRGCHVARGGWHADADAVAPPMSQSRHPLVARARAARGSGAWRGHREALQRMHSPCNTPMDVGTRRQVRGKTRCAGVGRLHARRRVVAASRRPRPPTTASRTARRANTWRPRAARAPDDLEPPRDEPRRAIHTPREPDDLEPRCAPARPRARSASPMLA